MRCRCGASYKVLDTREIGGVLRLRRCPKCGHIIYTMETEMPYAKGHSLYLKFYEKEREKEREKKRRKDDHTESDIYIPASVRLSKGRK